MKVAPKTKPQARPLPTFRVIKERGTYSLQSNSTGQFQSVIIGLDAPGVDKFVRGIKRAKVEGWSRR